ncbi:MAG: hypothetical protein IJE66_01140 [Akkermansia sp.]|nr:hypothetical protein [Akkermansia sp.]
MKTTFLKQLVLPVVALCSFSSCSYLECALSSNMEECMIGKTIDLAVNEITGCVDSVESAEQAEDLADDMDTLLTAIEAAQAIKMDVPESAKKAYNKALRRIVQRNYFNSDQVRLTLSKARYL